MPSLRRFEGYFLMDHRCSPGVPDEVLVAQGFPAGVGSTIFESATITCSHCEFIVVLNPDRSRSRGYCKKCDHYICDGCEAKRVLSGGECLPFKVMVEKYLNQVAKAPVTSEVFHSPLIHT